MTDPQALPCPTCKAATGELCAGEPHPILGIGFCQLRVAAAECAIDAAMMFRARALNWFDPFPPRVTFRRMQQTKQAELFE